MTNETPDRICEAYPKRVPISTYQRRRIARECELLNIPLPSYDTWSLPMTCEMANCSGVYFVWNDGKCVYVGQSACIAKRVPHKNCLIGDRVSWIPMDEATRLKAEDGYIKTLQPSRNVMGLHPVHMTLHRMLMKAKASGMYDVVSTECAEYG